MSVFQIRSRIDRTLINRIDSTGINEVIYDGPWAPVHLISNGKSLGQVQKGHIRGVKFYRLDHPTDYSTTAPFCLNIQLPTTEADPKTFQIGEKVVYKSGGYQYPSQKEGEVVDVTPKTVKVQFDPQGRAHPLSFTKEGVLWGQCGTYWAPKIEKVGTTGEAI